MKNRTYAAAPLGISLLLPLVLALLAGPIQAAEAPRTLAYHPAELNFADGRQSVLKRLRDVARLSCPRYGRVRELAEIARCQRAAMDDLVAQIGDPDFTAFVQRSGAHWNPGEDRSTPVVASH